LGVNPITVFLASAAAIVPLAKLMERASDALAHYLEPIYGGLLSATMGCPGAFSNRTLKLSADARFRFDIDIRYRISLLSG
jgi:hypothetical protein